MNNSEQFQNKASDKSLNDSSISQKSTSATNLKRIEKIVNSIFMDVEKIKDSRIHNDDVPEVESVLDALTKGTQGLKRVIATKNEQGESPKSTQKITKNISKLLALIESIEISDEDAEHLISALSANNKELSSHINMMKRRSDKSSKFSF
ncbi:hypothetical protein [Photobacterium damselae]|uniref:hypothetical protein n=1 Tax=Photobacterium damselae TaxID=38293 RepID=UPI001F42D90B|nr:hypothetical protein [Photobacterium damselae]UKA04652.1 hypothetical protein IHC89_23825 [Photobacterium damselae subsp. damselae]